jgi:hypothetical protein
LQWMMKLPEGVPGLFPSWKGASNSEDDRELRPITGRALGYMDSKYVAPPKSRT